MTKEREIKLYNELQDLLGQDSLTSDEESRIRYLENALYGD